jgi:chromate reductase, NAD(P)H dehydrogenase (quinone)
VNVLGISGSLRQGSYNSMALRAARRLAPPGMEITIADIRSIPMYDEDVRTQGLPATVHALKEQVRAADAILLVTPEYNFSIPGVLKNAIDWLSRPPEQPFDGKPLAIMGASSGPVGTARVQYHLRQVMGALNAFMVAKPEVFIGNCAGKFNEQGELTDETTAKFIGELLVSLQKLKTRVG